ncbi:hypothetical protein D8674_000367 [Pyrus ussuriensis x Pyrus communis]|uniref:Uncharacterized protein n=1 Tax=Pyrus ussuriensis x Pyrus communis TaxID=2448454 RepID=A0A5N5F3A3_9ROSA|nr:hypothetical protein D8674_000367 [Pyrus ussuriensis x Pyrus communis]
MMVLTLIVKLHRFFFDVSSPNAALICVASFNIGLLPVCDHLCVCAMHIIIKIVERSKQLTDEDFISGIDAK